MKKLILNIFLISFTAVLFAQTTSKTKTTTPPKTTTSSSKPTTTVTTVTTVKSTTPAKCTPINGIKPFAFTGSFVMNYTMNENNKNVTGKIFYAYDCYLNCMIPTFDLKKTTDFKLRGITDISDKTITMLTEDNKGKKNGLIFSLPKKVIVSDQPKNKFTVQKTNESKVIEGYTCTKYIITGDNNVIITAWITDKITINFKDMLASIGQSFKGKSPFDNSYAKEINGFSLETTINDKTNNTTSTITINNLKSEKPDAKLFSSDGYSLMDARGLPIFGGQ